MISDWLPHPIVADGRERAYEANVGKVRAEVEKEFADALAKAGRWRRILLRIEIEREIRRRMTRIAPPWGLYLCARSRTDRSRLLAENQQLAGVRFE